ncbi:5-bromo-4-chloroindolyl phosphate hydrolysis family protein [Aristaeella lactis]|uniref:5-bromo-4-chloroindolyl phosphate hydrolysis protein n=1 Tax=Aristaeella lactis TaxID=3046383 RepID=A0AC61PIS9_9FIRM|nr:5-bromo-4-chloroindolyl phosphate hydrolysis family protein [Aristaeella lactis]QUA53914.1 5-bromo-4-chloroindolyl phosphate hydrolysis family protein [Aristaeella lactis]SMC40963.1 5-bromo-4-chloroindolyl phosphate hydrolysis protein [Aristaeella lactis]
MSKKNPNSNKKSGGAGFIITLLILSSLSGFSFGGIIAGVLLGLGIGKITSIMGSGLDTTTHNRRDRERQIREDEAARRQAEENKKRLAAEAEARKRAEESKIPLTGDKIADQVITTGINMLDTIRKENAAIPDQELSEQMDNLALRCEQIFRTVSETPSKAPQVRKFMNYYLPTTLKMLANYRTMQQRGVSYGEMKEARETTVHGMNLILTACQKQIDNLHRDNMLDISTDIDVLEQMLKRDGFMENEIVESARTAAEAQMRYSSAPVMNFPVESESSDIPSASGNAIQSE